MHDEVKKIGGILKAAREARGMTQAVLSKTAGVALRTIIDLEKDKHLPKFEVLYRIVRILDIPTDLIFRPDKAEYTLEQEQLMRAVGTCDEQDQAVYMKLGWAYVNAVRDKTRADNL